MKYILDFFNLKMILSSDIIFEISNFLSYEEAEKFINVIPIQNKKLLLDRIFSYHMISYCPNIYNFIHKYEEKWNSYHVNKINRNQLTLLSKKFMEGLNGYFMYDSLNLAFITCIDFCIFFNLEELIKLILITNIISEDFFNKGLIFSCYENHLHIVKILLDISDNVNFIDYNKCFTVVLENDNIDLIKLFLSYPKFNLIMTNDLWFQTVNHSFEITTLLLEDNRFDPSINNNKLIMNINKSSMNRHIKGNLIYMLYQHEKVYKSLTAKQRNILENQRLKRINEYGSSIYDEHLSYIDKIIYK